MPTPKTELAIIGAGPGGLSAAISAAKAGVNVTLVDEYPRPGGQYLRAAHHPSLPPPVSATEARARKLLAQLSELDINLQTGTLVWGIEGHQLALNGPAGSDKLNAEAIIVATGARELVLPFPGWTLPGVMTLGAAQILAKEHGVWPGKRILLAGSGPLLLAAASALASASGVKILGIIEATRPHTWVSHAPALPGNWDRLAEGGHYLQTLVRHKIPYRFGRTVIRVEGEDHLTAATIARLDRSGKVIPNSHERIKVDTLCLGFGFVPNIELAQLAGCQIEFDPKRGGWVPAVDENMETSVPDLYAVGEATGVGGANAALVEGALAGLGAAQRLGILDAPKFEREAAPLKRRLIPLKRFGTMLNTLFYPSPELDALTTDDTFLCRCEEVTAGEIRHAIREGARTLGDLKNWTHVGQGPCQGRTCGPLLARLIAAQTGHTPNESGVFRPRPPLKPLSLNDLAKDQSL